MPASSGSRSAPACARSLAAFIRAAVRAMRWRRWASGTHELDGLQRKAQRAGFKTIAGPPGSRQRPDGKLLRWRTLGLETATPLVPFVIEWSADSPHPSADAPDAGRVAQLVFETPGPEPLRKALRALGVVADIRRASEPRIRLTLATTKGRVELR